MANPDTIWLAPECEEESLEGRSWCADNVWDENCGYCGAPPVKYIRADLVENLQSIAQKENRCSRCGAIALNAQQLANGCLNCGYSNNLQSIAQKVD
jgi:hypothetical protein